MPPIPERAASVTLRRATPGDAPLILAVHRQSILESGRTAYDAAACASWAAGLEPERYVAQMVEMGERFVVAEHAGGLAGFCSGLDSLVVGLYVHPRWARRGVGRRLLEDAETRIADAGYEVARIGAALSALAFYRAHGYRLVRRRTWATRGGVEIAVCDLDKPLRLPPADAR